MAITVAGYGLGWLNVFEAPIDIEAGTNQVSLHTATYTPNRDTHDFQSTLTNEVANGSGYTTGGVTLANVAMTYDTASDQVRLDYDNFAWTFTADTAWRYGVHWVNTAGAATTDPLLLLLDWGSSQTVSGTYTVTLDAAGIFAIDFT